jgi:hypothetical protein
VGTGSPPRQGGQHYASQSESEGRKAPADQPLHERYDELSIWLISVRFSVIWCSM